MTDLFYRKFLDCSMLFCAIDIVLVIRLIFTTLSIHNFPLVFSALFLASSMFLKLDSITVLLLSLATVIFVVGSALMICLIRYACLLRKQLSMPSDRPIKPSSMPVAIQTLPVKTNDEKVLEQNQNMMMNNSFFGRKKEKTEAECFEQGVALIDRPLGKALQPLKGMGAVLMNMQVNEQHWVRS